MQHPPSDRYNPTDLTAFAKALFAAAGFAESRAECIASVLVEADLLGHDTHGLHLAAPYLKAASEGSMAVAGEPEVVSDRGAAVAWDGKRLSGVWLTASALSLACERARQHGSATVVVRRSHHIACLAAYLTRATDQGCMALIASSDPSGASVAPFGGKRALFTPDPIAVGIPTGGEPILVDISASITTNGMTARLKNQGKRFPGMWATDAEGNPTDDPTQVAAEPPGALLPVGGLDHGHKGFGLALMIEAMTQALGGYGRADGAEGWGASVFIQVFDPEGFGGLEAFTRQTAWLAEACRQSPPRPGVEAVRLPGQRGLQHKRQAQASGLQLYPGIVEALLPWAEKLGVAPPKPL